MVLNFSQKAFPLRIIWNGFCIEAIHMQRLGSSGQQQISFMFYIKLLKSAVLIYRKCSVFYIPPPHLTGI